MDTAVKAHWFRDMPYRDIFRAFRMAIHPRKMVAAFLAVVSIAAVGWLMDLSGTVVVDPRSDVSELAVYVDNPHHLEAYLKQMGDTGDRVGVFTTLSRFSSERFHETLYSWFRIEQLQTVALPETVAFVGDMFKSLGWAFQYHTLYSSTFFVFILLVLALVGGSISRMAALQYARDERPGLLESLQFSCQRILRFAATFVIPLTIVLVVGIVVLILGLLGNLPWVGELLLALTMPLVMVCGALMVFLLLGVVVGGGLMSAAMAYEDNESFTAINNSFRYVYARPWRLGFYNFVAAAYGALTYLFVRLFAFGILLVTYRFMQLGFLNDNSKLIQLWNEPSYVDLLGRFVVPEGAWTMVLAAFLIRGSVLVIAGLVVAYVMSFFYSVNVIIYALLRQHVDLVDLSEIRIDVHTPDSPSNWPPTPTDTST